MEEDGLRVKPHLATFSSFVRHFHEKSFERDYRERKILQPHYNSMNKVSLPYANTQTPYDGICSHYLKKGIIRGDRGLGSGTNLIKMTAATWTADGRRLVCGLENGYYGLWENELFKFYKPIGVHVHMKENEIVGVPIRAIAWSHHGEFVASGDEDGVIKIMNSSIRAANLLSGVHASAVRSISFSHSDSKYVTCSDDTTVRVWSLDSDVPETTYSGESAHLSEVKCAEWHPYRSLIISGGRDSLVKLWDPRQPLPVCTIQTHKLPVNAVSWSANGTLFATGAKDGLVRVFDVRKMHDCLTFQGHDSDVTALAWHPQHERLLLSGSYNGSLIYWIAGESQKPHTIIVEAHRTVLNFIKWHPLGHCVASASSNGIIKFWSREPPGSKLNMYDVTAAVGSYEDPCYVMHGPPPANPNIPWTAGPVNTSKLVNMASGGGGGGGGGGGVDGSIVAGTSNTHFQSGAKNYPNSASGRGGGGSGRYQSRGGGGGGGGRGGRSYNSSSNNNYSASSYAPPSHISTSNTGHNAPANVSVYGPGGPSHNTSNSGGGGGGGGGGSRFSNSNTQRNFTNKRQRE